MASTRISTGSKKPQQKAAAFLMGLPSTGNRAELDSLIRRHISEPPRFQKKARIVSVDMGIKNLGICVLEAPHLAEPEHSTKPSPNASQPLKILTWKKLNVLDLLCHQIHKDLEIASEIEARKAQKPNAEPAITPKAFRPFILSKTAYQITQMLCAYNPEHILIESQRFRSGGGAAVQEWTLRVNALESMLWASLETLRALGQTLLPFEVREISPKRVGGFWCARPAGLGTGVPEDLFSGGLESGKEGGGEVKRKVEKKDKIAVVRSWLSDQKHPDVALEFSSAAKVTAGAFLSEGRRGGQSKDDSATESIRPLGKLDDLADCLLQAVAWVRWEENRGRIRDIIDTHHKTEMPKQNPNKIKNS